MITVTKKDLDNIMHRCIGPAHYFTIFGELSEVYEPGIEYSRMGFIAPFIHKKFHHQVPCTGVNGSREVRYEFYLIPFFYAAYFCRNETNERVIMEVLGYILKKFGHFTYPESCREEWELLIDLPFGDFHQYWGRAYPPLTDEETQKIKEITGRFDATYELLYPDMKRNDRTRRNL